MRGPIESHWSRWGRVLSLRVAIPAGATAEVILPAGAGARVTESGRELAQAVGVRVLRREENAVVLEVLSGEYRFCVE